MATINDLIKQISDLDYIFMSGNLTLANCNLPGVKNPIIDPNHQTTAIVYRKNNQVIPVMLIFPHISQAIQLTTDTPNYDKFIELLKQLQTLIGNDFDQFIKKGKDNI